MIIPAVVTQPLCVDGVDLMTAAAEKLASAVPVAADLHVAVDHCYSYSGPNLKQLGVEMTILTQLIHYLNCFLFIIFQGYFNH